MMVLLIVVLVLVVGAVVAVVAGRLGSDAMAEPTQTSAFALPDGPLGARGADSVHLDQALRGYNMGQVDAVLDRLFDEIASLERQLGVREGASTSSQNASARADSGQTPVASSTGRTAETGDSAGTGAAHAASVDVDGGDVEEPVTRRGRRALRAGFGSDAGQGEQAIEHRPRAEQERHEPDDERT